MGRPKIYNSESEKKKAARIRAKQAGCKEIHIAIPEEYKTIFDNFCAGNNMTQPEAFCYLLDLQCGFSDSPNPTKNKEA